MKKLAIGCGVVLLVVLVVVGAGGFFLWTKYVRPMTGTITELSQLADIEKQVRNTSSFSQPDSGELTEEMVARFAKVQAAMEGRLGSRMALLKAKYAEIDEAMKSERREASFGEAMGALKDLSGIMVEAKKAQVEALNSAGFSVREYEWIRQQVYAAVGMAAASFDVKDLQAMAQRARSEAGSEEPEELNTTALEHNKRLITPYEKKLREWAPFAYFGL